MTEISVSPTHRFSSLQIGPDEIDLRQLAHVLWQRRVSIVVIAVLGGMLGVLASMYLTRYRSEGLFLTPALTLGGYKPYEVALSSKPRLATFLAQSDQMDLPSAKLVQRVLDVPGGVQQAIRPVFAFTDRDAKQFGVKIEEAGIVGLHLMIEEAAPSDPAPVRVLAEYVRDTVINVDMEAEMRAQCLASQLRARVLRTEQIQADFSSLQHKERALTLKQIIGRNPSAAASEIRQVISLPEGGERFLSPLAQLVGVEVLISDLKLAAEARQRERTAVALKQNYYCQAQAKLENSTTGRAFLLNLPTIQKSVFAEQDGTSDIVEQTSIELEVQLASWNSRYLDSMRFVTSPEGAQTKVRNPSLRIALVLGAVVGGLLGVLLAFLRAWWRTNREVVMADDAPG